MGYLVYSHWYTRIAQVADEAVGHIPGDVIFVLVQVPHPHFRREGDDLHLSLTISLLESLVGFDRVFPHLDGHEVRVQKDDVTYCSEVVRISGEGMPKRVEGSRAGKDKSKGARGDMFITLLIDFPRQLTGQQKELVKQALA